MECNILDGLSNKVCLLNRTEDVNVNVFRINESKTLIKQISCVCKCKFDGKKCNLRLNVNVKIYQCECKNLVKNCACKKDSV